MQFFKDINKELKRIQKNKLFIISIMANDKMPFNKKDLINMLRIVDKLLICTYDYVSEIKN